MSKYLLRHFHTATKTPDRCTCRFQDSLVCKIWQPLLEQKGSRGCPRRDSQNPQIKSGAVLRVSTWLISSFCETSKNWPSLFNLQKLLKSNQSAMAFDYNTNYTTDYMLRSTWPLVWTSSEKKKKTHKFKEGCYPKACETNRLPL